MPYTSKRLSEYIQYWPGTYSATVPGSCSPSASESGLADDFADDGARLAKKRKATSPDPTQPTLQQYDFDVKPRGGSECLLVNEDWQPTTWNIFKFCELNFEHVTWDDLDESTRNEFVKMAPEARRLMGIKRGTVYLFAARIWRVLDAAIFQKTNTESIEWEHPYFKHQDDMLKELRKMNPTAPHSHKTKMWQQWDRLSLCLFKEIGGRTRKFTGRISPECFNQVIARGVGPLFPKELCQFSQHLLEDLRVWFLQWEYEFPLSEDYHYLLFAHPGTLETSFKFRSKFLEATAMIGLKHDYHGFEKMPGEEFEGRQVDLVVSPMVMGVLFSRECDFIRTPQREISMVVCAGWIEKLDEMEKQKGQVVEGASRLAEVWPDDACVFSCSGEEGDDAGEHGQMEEEVEEVKEKAGKAGKAEDEDSEKLGRGEKAGETGGEDSEEEAEEVEDDDSKKVDSDEEVKKVEDGDAEKLGTKEAKEAERAKDRLNKGQPSRLRLYRKCRDKKK
ncbi:hypothetical protein AK830_g10730 [Neonectria ditissima]|uniref:Uncharacterized protein n=1 Tax=Neonectria ditissima TaxID=78410 RepID=A0A0P7AP98_9HYPO|nr:hypothetical protein AK830_g10730 [Neonectria ditissima]